MNNTYPVLSAKDALTIGQAVQTHAGLAFDDRPYKNLIKSRPCRDAFEEVLLREIVRDLQGKRTSIMGAGGVFPQRKTKKRKSSRNLRSAWQGPFRWRLCRIQTFGVTSASFTSGTTSCPSKAILNLGALEDSATEKWSAGP